MPAFIITILLKTLGPQWIFKLAAIAAGLAAIVIAYGIWHHKIYMEGYNAHKALIIANDERTVGEALAGRSVYDDCVNVRKLRWDTATGQCSGR